MGVGDTEMVKAVFRGEKRVLMRKPAEGYDSATRSGRPRKRGREAAAAPPADLPLFDALRAWRAAEAKAQHVPPYVIFHDRTLIEIARLRPASSHALEAVNGVGEGKLVRYGQAVLGVVRGFEGG